MFRIFFSRFGSFARGQLTLAEAFWAWFVGGIILIFIALVSFWSTLDSYLGEKLDKHGESFDIDLWYFVYRGGNLSTCVLLIWGSVAAYGLMKTNKNYPHWHLGNYITAIVIVAWVCFVPFSLFWIGFSLLLSPWGL